MTRWRSHILPALSLALACILVAGMAMAVPSARVALAEDGPTADDPAPDSGETAPLAPESEADSPLFPGSGIDPLSPEGGLPDEGAHPAADGPVDADIGKESQPVRPKTVSFPGSGTEASPYRIADAAELVEFAQLYNSNSFAGDPGLAVELTDDIDLSGVVWEPIGPNEALPFVGTFDGGGHTVSNLKIADTVTNGTSGKHYAYGLFGYVAQGEIRTLQVTADVAVGAKSFGSPCAGTLAGVVAPLEGAEILIEDCSGTGTVAVTGGGPAYAGGLVGYVSLDGSGQAVRFSGGGSMTTVSTVNAAVANCAGGLIGFADVGAAADGSAGAAETGTAPDANADTAAEADVATTGAALTVSACEAFEAVSVQQSAPNISVINEAGGLIGGLSVNDEAALATLVECKANGGVSAEGDVNFNDAGGLIGFVQVLGGHLKYEECSASGDVKANGSASDAQEAAQASGGGLDFFSGGADPAEEDDPSASKSKNLHDTGNDTGGAVGYMLVDGGTAEALGLAASGNVSSTGTMAQNDGGGLIGYLDLQHEGSAFSLSACAATGDVEVRDGIANNAGGLIGWTDARDHAALDIKTSSSKGPVKADNGTENYAGGLLGNAEVSAAATCALTDCSSQSGVTSLGQGTYNEGGGLVASLYCYDGAQTSISSCFSTGAVEAKDSEENYAGGLVASLYAEDESKASVADCYALGDALASGSGDSNDAGGLVGYACADRGEVAISTSYSAGSVVASGGSTAFNNAGGIIGSADAFGRGSATVAIAGCVSLGESVKAADSAENFADRVLGAQGAKSTGELTLDRTFAWEDMAVNDAVPEETADSSGQSEPAATLLDSTFWANGETGPGFDSEGVWNVQDGRLPLLSNLQAAAYTPEYLAPADEAAPENAPAPDFDEYVTWASRILLVALGCLTLFLIGRALYRRHKRKKEEDEASAD